MQFPSLSYIRQKKILKTRQRFTDDKYLFKLLFTPFCDKKYG